MENKIALLLMCAGSGTRAGLGYNKLLYSINGQTIAEYTLGKFSNIDLDRYIVSSKADYDDFLALTKKHSRLQLILGGETRTQSVFNALSSLKGRGYNLVIIHDGARPFVLQNEIERSIELALLGGSAVAYSSCTDTIKIKEYGKIATLPRESFMSIKTPQTFDYLMILHAYESMDTDRVFTDDSSVFEACYGECDYFECNANNIKITHNSDIYFFQSKITKIQQACLEKNYNLDTECKALIDEERDLDMKDLRIGYGFDVHRLVKNRGLVLGGVAIPYKLGLLGHSDADVMIHAIMDAILSACALGDIGNHFPDNNVAYKNISSMVLLERVHALIKEKGFEVKNISAVIHAERPKLSRFIDRMRYNISNTLAIPIEQVGITATTHEGLGLVGRQEGIAASANALVILKANPLPV